MSKKIKCAIKFVRALLTNFHIKLFGLKEDKTENLLGIKIMLIGRYCWNWCPRDNNKGIFYYKGQFMFLIIVYINHA